VSLIFHSALRKLNTEPPIGASHQVLVIWLSSYRRWDLTEEEEVDLEVEVEEVEDLEVDEDVETSEEVS
jgi:hypothetical protein